MFDGFLMKLAMCAFVFQFLNGCDKADKDIDADIHELCHKMVGCSGGTKKEENECVSMWKKGYREATEIGCDDELRTYLSCSLKRYLCDDDSVFCKDEEAKVSRCFDEQDTDVSNGPMNSNTSKMSYSCSCKCVCQECTLNGIGTETSYSNCDQFCGSACSDSFEECGVLQIATGDCTEQVNSITNDEISFAALGEHCGEMTVCEGESICAMGKDGNFVCSKTGEEYQPCGTHNSCQDDLVCGTSVDCPEVADGDPTVYYDCCMVPGTSEKPCYPDNTCDHGYVCMAHETCPSGGDIDGYARCCVESGGENQPCHADSTCDANLICVNSINCPTANDEEYSEELPCCRFTGEQGRFIYYERSDGHEMCTFNSTKCGFSGVIPMLYAILSRFDSCRSQ